MYVYNTSDLYLLFSICASRVEVGCTLDLLTYLPGERNRFLRALVFQISDVCLQQYVNLKETVLCFTLIAFIL